MRADAQKSRVECVWLERFKRGGEEEHIVRCVCMCWVVWRALVLVCMWSSEENSGEWVLSVCLYLGSRNELRSLGLGGESRLSHADCCYLLSFENKASQIKLKGFLSSMLLKNAFLSYKTVIEYEHAFGPF